MPSMNVWANTRLERLVCWAAGGILGFGSPTIAVFDPARPNGRPTFREAWTGRVVIQWRQSDEP